MNVGDVVKLAGRKGLYRITEIKGDAAHLFGGTRRHEQYRVRPLSELRPTPYRPCAVCKRATKARDGLCGPTCRGSAA